MGRTVPRFKAFGAYQIDVRSRDHNPPHFHLIGPDFHALVDIQTLQVIAGTYKAKPLAEAIAWAADHEAELLAEWAHLNERD